MRKVPYETNEERNILIQEAQTNGEYLIEDAILLNEKYLIFDFKPLQLQSQPSIEDRVTGLEAAVAAILGGALG